MPGPLGEVHDEIHRGLQITLLARSDTTMRRKLERSAMVCPVYSLSAASLGCTGVPQGGFDGRNQRVMARKRQRPPVSERHPFFSSCCSLQSFVDANPILSGVCSASLRCCGAGILPPTGSLNMQCHMSPLDSLSISCLTGQNRKN